LTFGGGAFIVSRMSRKRRITELPKFVLTILERLNSHGYESYVVGGAVRDLLMGRTVTDWDVASSASPEEIARLFQDTRHFRLKHQTVTLVHEHRCYEVTSFRGGEEVGTRDIEADLARRDFTINAMALSGGAEEVLDPFQGREDIRERLVRTVGNPEDRFADDPLRMLRSVRLATEIGFRIDPGILEAVSRMGDEIHRVAQERIREELMKILLCQRPSIGFRLMKKTGLLSRVLPELLEGVGKRQNPQTHRYTVFTHTLETVDRVEAEPVLRLAALLHDIAKPRTRKKIAGKFHFYGHEEMSALLAREIMKRLKFSNDTTSQVAHLIALHMRDMDYHSNWSDGAVRRLIRDVGEENMGRFLIFREADLLAHGVVDRKTALFAELKARIGKLLGSSFPRKSRELAIDGHMVMEFFHLSPGPEVGRILHVLMERVTDHPSLNTVESLTAILQEMKGKACRKKACLPAVSKRERNRVPRSGGREPIRID
jgi:tRNA nucleotidyltransferase (CCA-adding enzyme)